MNVRRMVLAGSVMLLDRSCWTEGHELCVRRSGEAYKGRDCCTKRGVDPDFLAAHNLFPAGGEVNGDRSWISLNAKES